MKDMTFEARVTAAGLTPKPEDMAKLAMLVADLDRAAAAVRAPRSYAEEPLSALRLR